MEVVRALSGAYRIHVNGIVQGVGFRPFVYRIAQELNIKGWVSNTGDGVDIHAEGDEVEEFCRRLVSDKPPLALIVSLDRETTDALAYAGFQIVKSRQTARNDVLISPDVATCGDCAREMSDPGDRRFRYPFINCTNCGPRYTIVSDRPYDRNKTTMEKFEMCAKCGAEYRNPADRRFHAQPVACAGCGPRLRLLDAGGIELREQGLKTALQEAAAQLEAGAILAVKGLGGFHLVCNAHRVDAIARLRRVKERGPKPFAIMARNVEAAAREVAIGSLEKTILTSPAAPIVILARSNQAKSALPAELAPGLHTLGVMLPYTPVHHLLMEGAYDFLVMTSANLSGRPLIYQNEAALAELQGIADYFLLHDRDIYHPCDDSVVQVVGGQMTFIRRARGYVPLPVMLKENLRGSFAGLGGEMKNAFCLAAGRMAFMSQYIGDMHGYENLERFKQEFYSYRKVANIFPENIALDAHPEYATTALAKSMDCPKYLIQHHHAHLASVMGEYGFQSPMLGLICDGTGYGADGKTWGFEYLYGNAAGCRRLAHLEYYPLPGGDAGAKYPLRIAYAYLKKSLSGREWLKTEAVWKNLSLQERAILDGQMKTGLQLFDTSSAGRLFDAVSGLLGVCREVTYEGQAAVELESAAAVWAGGYGAMLASDGPGDRLAGLPGMGKEEPRNSVESILGNIEREASIRLAGARKALAAGPGRELIALYNRGAAENSKLLFPVRLEEKEDHLLLKLDSFLAGILKMFLDQTPAGQAPAGQIAYCFHYSLALAMLESALIIGYWAKLWEDPGNPLNNKIIIGGGVFQNKLLTEILLHLAGKAGLGIYFPVKLPAGDGGLALGQVLIADKA